MLIHKVDGSHAGIPADTPFAYLPQIHKAPRAPGPGWLRANSTWVKPGHVRERWEGAIPGDRPPQPSVPSGLRGTSRPAALRPGGYFPRVADPPRSVGSAARPAPPTGFHVFLSSQLENSPTLDLSEGGPSSLG